jgi:phosphate transport system permease protein
MGVLGLLVGTVLVASVAITIAVPFSILAGLCITEYASLRLRGYLTGLVDLLAAIPSLIFGIWGFLFLSDQIVPLSRWLPDHFAWIPIFKPDPPARPTGTIFIAAIVRRSWSCRSSSVVREVFAQTPPVRGGGVRWAARAGA